MEKEVEDVIRGRYHVGNGQYSFNIIHGGEHLNFKFDITSALQDVRRFALKGSVL